MVKQKFENWINACSNWMFKHAKIVLILLLIVSILFAFSIQRNLGNLHEDALFLALLGENIYLYDTYSLQTPFQLETFGGELFRTNIIENSKGLSNLPMDQYPPLIPLLWVLAYSLFGLGLHAVLLITIISFLMPLLIYALGHRMYDTSVGLIAGVVLFSSPYLFWLSFGMTDVIFAINVYLGLFALYGFLKTDKPIYMLVLGLSLGLATLTRITGVIFLIIVPLTLIIVRGTPELRKLKSWYWVLPFFLLLGSWQAILFFGNSESTYVTLTTYFLEYKEGGGFQPTYVFSFLDSLFETPAEIMGAFAYLLAGVGVLGWYKKRDLEGKLLLMWVLAALPFFVFYKSEPRLLFAASGSIAIFAGRGFWFITSLFKERKREMIALLMVLLMLSYVAGLNYGRRHVEYDYIGPYAHLADCGKALNERFSEYLDEDEFIWIDAGSSLRYYADYKMIYTVPNENLWRNDEALKEFRNKYGIKHAVFCDRELPGNKTRLIDMVGDARLYEFT